VGVAPMSFDVDGIEEIDRMNVATPKDINMCLTPQ
jgi:hypothetical protein